MHTFRNIVVATVLLLILAAFVATVAFAANLITNGTFETEGAPGVPAGWIKGRWGTNTAEFSYPVTGVSGSRAARVMLTTHTSGDAKWAHDYVSVSPGTVYTYSDRYIATVPSILTVEYKMGDGSLVYEDLKTVPVAGGFVEATGMFTPPSGATSARVFHLINQVGSLTIDNVTLEPEGTPPSSGNLVPNPSLEGESNGLPVNWGKGRWGVNTAVFEYPVPGHTSAKAGRVVLTAYTSGDAKWHFSPVPVSAGEYVFSDWSKSDVGTVVTVQFTQSNGTHTYLDLGTVPPSANWQQFQKTFTVPAGVTSLTVFHVLNRVGTLDTDTYSLTRVSGGGDPTLFDKGYVTLTFDDGYRTDYDVVYPRLQSAGFRGTFFIVTERMAPGDFPGFIKVSEILELQSAGHEIGAHTRTHPNLTALSPSAARAEIQGSRDDLLAVGVTPANVFAYPFGAYNPSIQSFVKGAGFFSARSSDGGFNKRNTDKYALKRKNMTQGISVAEVKADIDTAIAEKTWLILLFHRVDTSGDFFTVTPSFFNDVIAYLESKGVTPISVAEGVSRME